jgi:hypothetical protein
MKNLQIIICLVISILICSNVSYAATEGETKISLFNHPETITQGDNLNLWVQLSVYDSDSWQIAFWRWIDFTVIDENKELPHAIQSESKITNLNGDTLFQFNTANLNPGYYTIKIRYSGDYLIGLRPSDNSCTIRVLSKDSKA